MSIDVLFQQKIKYDYISQRSQLHKCWVKCLGIIVPKWSLSLINTFVGKETSYFWIIPVYATMPSCIVSMDGGQAWKRLCHFLLFICNSLDKSTICVNGSRPYTGCWHLTLILNWNGFICEIGEAYLGWADEHLIQMAKLHINCFRFAPMNNRKLNHPPPSWN